MAGNRDIIKGITIKIGGDTTELGKAMESVNKQSDTLSNELREINRMLKFDPDNADLLAQKQKVLAGTVENTKEKLDKLKEAERQVQAQFARDEVSAAQVRALQREIIKTEGQLESYEQQAEEAAKGTKELADSADKAGEAGEGMGAKFATAAKVGIGAVIAGATAAVGALVGTAEATREYRTEMGKLTTAFETVGHRTEIAEEAYKRLYGVIGETDQTVEAAQQIALLAESEEDVIQWADLGAGVIGRFGDALQPETFFEAANETIKLGEATGAYTQLLEGAGYDVEKFNEGLAACTTETEKQAYMLEVTESLLGDAADTYRETNKAIIDANKASEAWTATLAEVGEAVEPILTAVKMLGTAFLEDLVPGIKAVTEAFSGLISGKDGSAKAVGEALSKLLSDILNKIVNALPALADAVVSLVTSLVNTLIEMIPQLVETAGEIINALVQGLTEALPQIAQAIVDMIPKLVETLKEQIPVLIEGAVDFFMALVDAIDMILPPLVEALPQIVTTLVEGLMAHAPEMIQGAIQLLQSIIEAIPIFIKALLPEIPKIVTSIIDGLLACIPELVDGAVTLLMSILDAIPEIIKAIAENAPSIVMAIVKGILKAIPELFKAGGQLLQGLIDGMLDFDIWGAIKGIGESIIDGFKSIFDINSPSRVMADMGEMLDEGLAVGITDNADAPMNALDKVSNDMIDGAEEMNGVTLERRMTHTFDTGTAASSMDGLSTKLDQIYQAVLKGHVIMLDSKTLVGSTAERYDNAFGQRRVLAERGAI